MDTNTSDSSSRCEHLLVQRVGADEYRCVDCDEDGTLAGLTRLFVARGWAN